MKKNNLKGSLILVFASLLWGMAFVAQNHLIETVGSDCHYTHAVGTTAMVFPEPIRSTADIVRHLRNRNYDTEKN